MKVQEGFRLSVEDSRTSFSHSIKFAKGFEERRILRECCRRRVLHPVDRIVDAVDKMSSVTNSLGPLRLEREAQYAANLDFTT